MFIKHSTLGDGSFNSGAYAVGMNAMYLQAQPGSSVDANKVITAALANPQLNNPGILATGTPNQNNVAAEQAALMPGASGVAVSTSPPIFAKPAPAPAPVVVAPVNNRVTIQPVTAAPEPVVATSPPPIVTSTPTPTPSTPDKSILIPQVATGGGNPATLTTQSVAAGPGGWAIDPATGWPIDPATGLLLNPETGEEMPPGTAVASAPDTGVSSNKSWLWLAALAGLYYLST